MSCSNDMIKRGATPRSIFKLPFDPSIIKICQIPFCQHGDVKFIKNLEDCQIEDDKLICPLSLEDTLSLEEKVDVEMQLIVTFQDGTRDNSNILHASVYTLLLPDELLIR